MTAPPDECPDGSLRQRRVDLPNGLTVNYAESGQGNGPAIVFLHGYADSWRSFEPVVRALSPRFHCLAPDLRGHGGSSKPDRRYAMDDYAEDLRLFLEELGTGESILVGHSMGSFAAQHFAAIHPERTRRLVLVSSSVRAKGNAVLEGLREEIAALRDPVPESFIRNFQEPGLPVPACFMQTIIAESGKVPARVWKAAFEGLLHTDNTDLAARIEARTLIIWGENDAIFKKNGQDELKERISGSSLVQHPAGHALHWEIPERVAEDIAGFLDG